MTGGIAFRWLFEPSTGVPLAPPVVPVTVDDFSREALQFEDRIAPSITINDSLPRYRQTGRGL